MATRRVERHVRFLACAMLLDVTKR